MVYAISENSWAIDSEPIRTGGMINVNCLLLIALKTSRYRDASFAVFALSQDGDRNRKKVFLVNDQDKQTSRNSFEEHNIYQFMYKPNIKLTERARVASPHFPTDWNRHSIETYFFE